MSKILVIEDEKSIVRFLQLELAHEGFEVDVAYDGREGVERFTTGEYDLVLLDLMLPHLNGIEICSRIRKTSSVPIIMITARDQVMDRVIGLDAGADDYIVKPFAIEELLARIRSVMRRTVNTTTDEQELTFREISVSLQQHTVKVNGQVIELTKTEMDLLVYLMQNLQHVLTRDQLLENVWGFASNVETNVVDVYIRHLRSKLPEPANHYVQTVRGVGYVMRE